jgi:hypothetical protein
MKQAYNRGVLIGHTRYGLAILAPQVVVDRRARETGDFGRWRPTPIDVPPPGTRRCKGVGWVKYQPDGRAGGRVWKLRRPRPHCETCGRQVYADFELYRSDWGLRWARPTMCLACYEADAERGPHG